MLVYFIIIHIWINIRELQKDKPFTQLTHELLTSSPWWQSTWYIQKFSISKAAVKNDDPHDPLKSSAYSKCCSLNQRMREENRRASFALIKLTLINSQWHQTTEVNTDPVTCLPGKLFLKQFRSRMTSTLHYTSANLWGKCLFLLKIEKKPRWNKQ